MQSRLLYLLLAIALTTFSACGGCDDVDGTNVNPNPNNTTVNNTDLDAQIGDGSQPQDALLDDGKHTGPEDANAADAPPIDPDEVFTPDNGCGNFYQKVCDNRCVNIKLDADNCGECGTVCGDSEVCSGGMCASGCLGNDTTCGRSCVQTASDNAHCGACDRACADGEGCNNGTCVPAAVFQTPAQCRGGGRPIDLEGGDVDRCAGEVAEEKFRWAMCACQQVDLTSGGLYTDAFDSLQGPYVPGILGASVGINSNFKCTAPADIGGSLWVGGPHDLTLRGKVHMDMFAGRHASAGGGVGIDVLQNAKVGATINPGGGGIRVSDTLTVPATTSVGNGVTYGTLVREPVAVPLPCQCAPDEILPIPAYIAASRDKNDNALIGLDPSLLNGATNFRRLDLPCGSYYLNGINLGTDITIVAHGRTALFIDGNVNAARLTMLASPGAELDVFIGGDITAAGLNLGSPAYPAATRFYFGGSRRLVLSDSVDVNGFLYVYPGEIHITKNTEVFGGLFANKFSVSARLTIHYDRRILNAGETCREPDPDPDPDPDGDAGGHPDIGPGPDAGPGPDPDQCIALAGSCTTDGNCCAPLVCDQGKCASTRCRVVNETCVYNGDCCSGICAKPPGSTQGSCIVN
ncbi:MAG: hypothetical protein H0U74_22235 [Bradymonadaceae bacterium]|nr:hypothetical protein [Lujinxingiaceae bacterium]